MLAHKEHQASEDDNRIHSEPSNISSQRHAAERIGREREREKERAELNYVV